MEKDAGILVVILIMIVLVCDLFVVIASSRVAAECAVQHKHKVSDWVGFHCE